MSEVSIRRFLSWSRVAELAVPVSEEGSSIVRKEAVVEDECVGHSCNAMRCDAIGEGQVSQYTFEIVMLRIIGTCPAAGLRISSVL